RDLHSFPPRRSSDLCPVLIAQAGGLLKSLIVVNPERTSIHREETCAVMAHGRVPLKAFDVDRVHTERNAIQLGFFPGDRKRNRRDRKSTRLNSSHLV